MNGHPKEQRTWSRVVGCEGLRKLLDAHMAGRYTLEILDVATHVAQATEDQIVCVPTLLRRWPQPMRRIIGDMSDSARVLKGLDVPMAR